MGECATCGHSLAGMKDAARRKYCSWACMRKGFLKKPQTPEAGRNQAHVLFEMRECANCGAVEGLHRHHMDRNPTNNDPENIKILCVICHIQEHKNLLPESTCIVCGKGFIAASHRNRNKVCSATCASEWGRICAKRRWSGTASDDCAPTAMPSSRRSRPK